MTSKNVVGILALAILAGSVLYAADPWNAKPPKDWTQKDVEKITTKSPWAQRTDMSISSVYERKLVYRDGDSTRPDDVIPVTNRYGEVVGYKPAAPQAESSSIHIPCLIQWGSARIMRQADIRASVLEGLMAEEDAEQISVIPYDENYEIRVQAPGLLLMALGENAREWREAAHLKLKSTKEEIQPADLRVRGQGDSVELTYVFPRERDGRPLIGPGEEKVEFFLVSKNDKAKVTFDLRKMIRDGAPDL